VNDHLEALAKENVPGVAVLPIGFVSDHMEVIYDLDTEAKATAEKLGLPFRRIPTPGVDPRFVAMVRELVTSSEPPSLGTIGPRWGDCPAGCCANLRGLQPALCGED
jgi:ferrochelatase